MEELKKTYDGLPALKGYQTFVANVGGYADEILRGALSRENYAGIARWDEIMTDLGYPNMVATNVPVEYSDQLMPFDVTIHFANEYGQRAQIDIYGVEILNNGMSISIDDVVTEHTYTFVARSIKEMRHVD